jgi:dihydrofolate reductase
MRKVTLGLAVTLDGFIEGPNGEYDWCFTDQDYGMSEFFNNVDAIFMGRKSWDLVASQAAGNAGGSEANPYKGMTTYVFSNTLKKTDREDVVIVSGDIIKEIKRLVAQPGKNIWLFGGAELTTLFINEDLVDELWLSIHPLLLGSGKPLFQNIGERKNLKLVTHKVYNTGLVSLLYQKI